MEYIILVAAFASAQAYASSVRRRTSVTMPFWWSTSGGRLALGICDLLVLLLTIALVVWGFIALQWWAVIIVFVVSGLFLAPLITTRLQPFSVAFFCGVALIVASLMTWV